jgi:hypothetical protein
MGANYFEVEATGRDAFVAFNNAVADATEYFGTQNYTGSIKEKPGFYMVPCDEGIEAAMKKIDELTMEYDDTGNYSGNLECFEKWSRCACIKIEKGRYIFFGIASS